jgi:hypothetical protein
VARGSAEADARDDLEVVEVEVQDALLAADVKENVDEKENVEEKDCFGRWVRAAPRHQPSVGGRPGPTRTREWASQPA